MIDSSLVTSNDLTSNDEGTVLSRLVGHGHVRLCPDLPAKDNRVKIQEVESVTCIIVFY